MALKVGYRRISTSSRLRKRIGCMYIASSMEKLGVRPLLSFPGFQRIFIIIMSFEIRKAGQGLDEATHALGSNMGNDSCWKSYRMRRRRGIGHCVEQVLELMS